MAFVTVTDKSRLELEIAQLQKDYHSYEMELKTEKTQHRRQAIKGHMDSCYKNIRIAKLELENLILREDALATVMGKEARWAQNTVDRVHDEIKQTAKEMQSRLERAADRLAVYVEHNRYEDLLYFMASELTVIVGNTSYDSIGRMRADLAKAEQILEMANPKKAE